MKKYYNHISILKKQVQYILYDMLLNAKNCKIIFLTGTPIINKPNDWKTPEIL